MIVWARLQKESEQMQDRKLSIYSCIKFSIWLILMLITQ